MGGKKIPLQPRGIHSGTFITLCLSCFLCDRVGDIKRCFKSEFRRFVLQRYLLFDSGCQTCSSLAQLVADESHGWLDIHSLREPAMQELLHRGRPGWKWEPTLLTIEGEQVEVFTGWQLRMQMVRGLGLRRAGRIAQLISQFPGTSVTDSSRRRQFLKVGGAVVGGLALGLGFGLPKASLAASGSPITTDATPLALTDPVIASMKTSRHVRLASKHFGAPDWSRVFKFTYGPQKKTGYGVFLQGGDTRASTVLFFGRAPRRRGSAKPQSAGKQRRHSRPLVFRLTADAHEHAKVEWFTPSATLVAVAAVTKSGPTALTPVAPDGSVQPNSFKCAVICGAVLAQACRADCIACGVAPNPVDCGLCAVCVGAGYYLCSDCLATGLDASGSFSGSPSDSSGSDSGGGGSNSGSHVDCLSCS